MSLFMGLVWQGTFLSVALVQISVLQAIGVLKRGEERHGRRRAVLINGLLPLRSGARVRLSAW